MVAPVRPGSARSSSARSGSARSSLARSSLARYSRPRWPIGIRSRQPAAGGWRTAVSRRWTALSRRWTALSRRWEAWRAPTAPRWPSDETSAVRASRGWQRGSVTAEAALVLPVLVLVLAIGVGTIAAVTAQLRCIDAAREGARAAARGESLATARSLAAEAAPAGADIAITQDGDRIQVTVSAEIAIGDGLLPPVTVQGTALAVPEPTAAAGTTARGP